MASECLDEPIRGPRTLADPLDRDQKRSCSRFVLLLISLAALFGDVHYAQLSDFADSWGQADRQFLSAMAQKGTVLGPTRLMRLAVVSGFMRC